MTSLRKSAEIRSSPSTESIQQHLSTMGLTNSIANSMTLSPTPSPGSTVVSPTPRSASTILAASALPSTTSLSASTSCPTSMSS